jgi:uncharacterized membrane protein
MTGNYEIRIGKNLQEAWNLFLKAPEIFITIALLQFALSIVLNYVPGLGFLASLLLIAAVVPAYILVADEVSRTGRGSLKGLKNQLLEVLPQMVVMLFIKLTFIGVGIIFFVIPGIYLAVIYLFADFFCVLEKKTFWEALEASRALVKGNWFPVFGLACVFFLVLFTGFLFLGVGVVISGPLSLLLLYAAFRDIRSQTGVTPGVIDAEIVP